jgi:hypothetical protein
MGNCIDIGSRWAVSFTHRLIYPWWRRLYYPLPTRLGEQQTTSGYCEGLKSLFLSLTELELRPSTPLSLVISTELSRDSTPVIFVQYENTSSPVLLINDATGKIMNQFYSSTVLQFYQQTNKKENSAAFSLKVSHTYQSTSGGRRR